jgi:uncharacterized membrane-anchored protein
MSKLLTVPRLLILLGALLVLGALNYAIYGKEHIKTSGEIVYLRLAPVDPRSLMQGDYMALRFGLVQELEKSLDFHANQPAQAPREGEVRWANFTLAADHVASLSSTETPLKLRYRIRNNQVWLGTNAFFFQEGDAQRFSTARYGEFRVDRNSGEAVLVGLCDEALKAL